MVKRGLARSRSEARHLIASGRVAVAGSEHPKPATAVTTDTPIELHDADRFASRAGEKLAAAFDRFQIQVQGKIALDAGASTGGFTDCLLRRGAAQVVAVDVGRDQLRSELRADPRVQVFEGLDIGKATPAMLGGPFDLIVADLSFVSLCVVAPGLSALANLAGDVVVLVKPQFEVGRELVGRGVVADPSLRRGAVDKVTLCFGAAGLDTSGIMESPVTGEKGNQEYLLWARKG
jgi:23S rRNA (cytidine1920-2'-O)/16S rRNA (cytidine1409-2'-O)-methyltransferase